MRRPSRKVLLLLCAITAVAVVVRIVGLDYSLWYDEVASVKFAGTPLSLLWSDWMIRETNPPLYYSLLRGWMGVFGSSDLALRSLSVLIGGCGIPLAFEIGRRAFNARAGLIAAALTALSTPNVLYSQQVRGYILTYVAALAAVLGTLMFLDAVAASNKDRPPSASAWRALLLYSLACITALYSHSTMVVLPILVNLFVFTRLLTGHTRRWSAWFAWVLANFGVLLCWLWWAFITLQQAGRGHGNAAWIGRPSIPFAVRMTLESDLPWRYQPAEIGLGVATIAALIYLVRRDRGNFAVWLLLLIAAGTPGILYLLSLRVPVFLPRTVFWSSGAVLILVDGALAALPIRAMVLAVTGALVVSLIGLIAWFPHREIEPWREITQALQRTTPGAYLVTRGDGPAFAVQRYCPPLRCGLQIHTLPDPLSDGWASGFPPINPVEPRAAARAYNQGRAMVVIRWLGDDPAAIIRPTDTAPVDLGLTLPEAIGVERLLPPRGGKPQTPSPKA